MLERYFGASGAALSFDAARSALSLSGDRVAFHCDKFNTRILKNFEDVMGYEDGGKLLCDMAASTTYAALNRALVEGENAAAFAALDLRGKLEAITEYFKLLAYGAIEIVELSPTQAKVVSSHSYLAEGWLENKKRWNLDERMGPACHDLRGHLAAAMCICTGRPLGSFHCTETLCRAYKNGERCEFTVEVQA
ncbi:MAG: hypothetical protein RBU37_24625 [Myxococcota bacterium]|jgi:hypothetical protein|nr:hypothetical protein [Myxococcota bacterium]